MIVYIDSFKNKINVVKGCLYNLLLEKAELKQLIILN